MIRVIVVLICIPFFVILFISPISKYLIEKYDLQYTGRQIEMDWAYVNPFSGYVYLSGIKMLELESDSVFFSTKGISLNVAMCKLFSKTYEISQLNLDQPRFLFIQNENKFIFCDFIEKFSSKDTFDTNNAPLHFILIVY